MQSITASPLESLPLLVLERICEYLEDDDFSERRSLRSLSLTSRCCCAATAAQRFGQIQLKILAPEEPEIAVKQWMIVLKRDDRYRHVRRLKIMGAMTVKERLEKDLLRKNGEIDLEEDDEIWKMPLRFALNNFCCSSSLKRGLYVDHPEESWITIGRFVSQLPGLQDLVWSHGNHIPRCVLSAISTRGCRFHMHVFHLGSVVQVRDSPHSISLDEYAVASSPFLSSIVVGVHYFEDNGMLNYIEDAVMRMVAGTAPNLKHIRCYKTSSGDSLAYRAALRLGMPAWSGFFPGTPEGKHLAVRGSLQSLSIPHRSIRSISHWASVTDFTQLRRLIMLWSPRCCVAFAELVVSGSFMSLDTLGLSAIEDDSDQTQEALKRVLQNLNPLTCLELSGHISKEAFDIVLQHHSIALHNLAIETYRDSESVKPLVQFSEAVIQRLVNKCPNLGQVRLQINKTRGDIREIGIYNALNKLPRLKRAFLTLMYSVGPDEEYWEEEVDGEYPLIGISNAEEIPITYLREAFRNSAMDATLALSIFELISFGSSLEYLKVEPKRKLGLNLPANFGLGEFQALLRWLSRPWICKRDVSGRVTIKELDEKGSANAGKHWEFQLSDEEKWYGDEVFGEAFRDLWPQRTAEPWNDWKSLPLLKGVAQ